MAGTGLLIIPIFTPFGGCPHRCVFCDQTGITGTIRLPDLKEVSGRIKEFLSTWKKGGKKEVAFYGGSFTGLERDLQKSYLHTANGFLEKGLIDGIRVSTRPDYVSADAIEVLKRYGVDTVELGVQSMSDEVLRLSGRGHGSEDTRQAMRLLKGSGLKVGVQLMPGLPGDNVSTILSSARKSIQLRPDFVRIYPTVILKDTALHGMYLEGRYRAWSLEEMVSVCSKVSDLFNKAGIKIIRMGLQPTEELETSLVAGPYHPSFRQLVEKEALNTSRKDLTAVRSAGKKT